MNNLEGSLGFEMDIGWINNWAKENNYKIVHNGKNPKIVIVGEMHDNKSFIEQQGRLIDKLRPEYLLDEGLGIKTYNPLTNQEAIQKNRKFGGEGVMEIEEIKDYLLQWSKKYGVFLVGCDLSDREIFNLGKVLAKKFPKRYFCDPVMRDTIVLDDPSEKDFPLTALDGEIIKYRDRKMGETMIEYVKKTTKPLVTIMGSRHIRSESPIHQILKNSNIGYICVDQTYGEKNSK